MLETTKVESKKQPSMQFAYSDPFFLSAAVISGAIERDDDLNKALDRLIALDQETRELVIRCMPTSAFLHVITLMPEQPVAGKKLFFMLFGLLANKGRNDLAAIEIIKQALLKIVEPVGGVIIKIDPIVSQLFLWLLDISPKEAKDIATSKAKFLQPLLQAQLPAEAPKHPGKFTKASAAIATSSSSVDASPQPPASKITTPLPS